MRIRDPYSGARRWAKGQLHVHTDRSFDGRTPASEMIRAYGDLGFHFVCITDHDRLWPECSFVDGVLVVPGEESTLVRGVPPLGRHLARLFVPAGGRVALWWTASRKLEATRRSGALTSAAHPAWSGNLGTGRWPVPALADPRLSLIEIVNHHAPTRENVDLWDRALRLRGPDSPLWAAAVDDAHHLAQVGRAWVWVGLPELQPGPPWPGHFSPPAAARALRDAIVRGALYASTGVEAQFGVEPGEDGRASITARVAGSSASPATEAASPGAAASTIRFVGPEGRSLASHPGPAARFAPPPGVPFVRVEVEDAAGRAAWSQPFWITSGPS